MSWKTTNLSTSVRSLVAATVTCALSACILSACGADATLTSLDEESVLSEQTAPEFETVEQDITGGWYDLTPLLRNGWVAAANSNPPQVGKVGNEIVFRGAVSGANATSNIVYCLGSNGPSSYRQSDTALVTVRAALNNGATGSLRFDVPTQPNIPAADRYCMSVLEDNATSQPGASAKALTSLEGVSFDRSVNTSTVQFVPQFSLYPHRGSDSNAHPSGNGTYGLKMTNNFVRFQGALNEYEGGYPVVLTIPSSMTPGNPVYLPVSLCPQNSPPVQGGRIVIQQAGAGGEVRIEGPQSGTDCGFSLDGTSFSLASSAGSDLIPLSNNWVAHSARAVRVREADGIVRLEGAVKNGTTTTIGRLPTGKRPGKKIYITSNAILFAQKAVLSIDMEGYIKIVSPSLVVAQPGISLDGILFGI